jgi:hypothetical protein
MTKRKQLGTFYRGVLVDRSSYGGLGRICHTYGRVTRIDIKESVVYWTGFGVGNRKHRGLKVAYPPPRNDVPSSWKFNVIREDQLPERQRHHLVPRKTKPLI